MKTPSTTQHNNGPQNRVFAARFLESGLTLVVPDGHYDPDRQIYIREDDEKPAFVNEYLCTEGGNVSGTNFSDPDNG